MPLGMIAKDSMLNLAELANNKEGDTESSSLPSNAIPGEEQLVRVLPKEECPKTDVTADDDPVTESAGSHSLRNADAGEPEIGDQNPIPQVPVTSITPLQQSGDVADVESATSDISKALTLDDNTSATTVMDSKDSKENTALNASNSSVASVESPREAKMETAKAAGQYSGFSADYHDFEHYAYHSSYDMYENVDAGAKLLANHLDSSYREEIPWWCCFFPWITGEKMIEDDASSMQAQEGDQGGVHDDVTTRETSHFVEQSDQGNYSKSSLRDDDDEISTGSEIFGEKLSDKDRQAVLARLRLVQPYAANPPQVAASDAAVTTSHSSNYPPPNGSKQDHRIKGILKRSSTILNGNNESLDRLSNESGRESLQHPGRKRRSLFPSYEAKVPSKKKDLHPHFAPMARVVTIKSLKDMTEQEKASVWWQKPDYEEFRRTGRMITKAMLEGGSEIWLATNQSWQMPNQGKAQTLQLASSLADRHAAFQKGDIKAKEDYEDTRDKWWHKFGHSRRGLEHIASIDEGRQRQANVKASIRAVLEEQRRQRVFNREDPEKLRMVSIQSTAWAKDLALASAASDADAVQKNFDDESRKTREFYLLKFSRAHQTSNLPNRSKKVVPAFMKPMLTMQIASDRLDANTTSQIRYRQKQQQPSKRYTPEISGPSTHVPIRGVDDSHSTSMAKKAAGFASGEEVGNMSAILTGMGGMGPPIGKTSTATVGGP